MIPPICFTESTYDRYYLSGFVVQSMREVFVECNEVRDVNVAVVLLRKHIFSYLIAVK